jgi:hypothetical protein
VRANTHTHTHSRTPTHTHTHTHTQTVTHAHAHAHAHTHGTYTPHFAEHLTEVPFLEVRGRHARETTALPAAKETYFNSQKRPRKEVKEVKEAYFNAKETYFNSKRDLLQQSKET